MRPAIGPSQALTAASPGAYAHFRNCARNLRPAANGGANYWQRSPVDAKGERPTRRVVIGLEPAMLDAAALAAAARLAQSAGAELAALFVEDINLLRLASLPFAQEIGAASAVRRRMAAADIERALKVQAAQLKRALADAAQRLELQWTFEVARGRGLRVLLEWTGASDILVLAGGPRRPTWQPALEALLRGTFSLERAVPGRVAVALSGGPEAMD